MRYNPKGQGVDVVIRSQLKTSGRNLRAREHNESPAAAGVLLVARFQVHPMDAEMWQSTCLHLRSMAERDTACRSAQFAHHRQNQREFTLVTAWNTAGDAAQFVRQSGLLWIEHALYKRYPRPVQIEVFDLMPASQTAMNIDASRDGREVAQSRPLARAATSHA